MSFFGAVVSIVAIVFGSGLLISLVAINMLNKKKGHIRLKELEERIKKLESTVHTEQNSRLENLEHIVTNGSKEDKLL